MKCGKRIEHARDMGQRRSLRALKRTDPYAVDQHERTDELRDLSHFDDRQVSSVSEEADVQLQPRPAAASNINVRSSTRRTTRPPVPRLEPRCLTCWQEVAIDLLGSRAVEHVVRSVAVV